MSTFNILIVDNDDDVLQTWSDIVSSEGRRIFRAHSGHEALKAISEKNIHLVITDIEMPVDSGPVMNGFDLIHKIKETKGDIYVIFTVDDHETIEDIIHGLEDGAVDFLKEPLHPGITKAKVAVFEKLYQKRSALLLERKKSEDLLRNILPESTIKELIKHGKTTAKNYDMATVMFTDFVNFTSISEQMSPQMLLTKLNLYFSVFDYIMDKWHLEKIKTIGDAYMAASGVPIIRKHNAVYALLAALEINQYILDQHIVDPEAWEIRIGLHSGPVVSGIVGVKKYQFDIWGDTVNTAARVENNAIPGTVNITTTTYEQVKDYFDCTYRGKLEVKNKGLVEMYNVEGLQEEYSHTGSKHQPNSEFLEILSNM